MKLVSKFCILQIYSIRCRLQILSVFHTFDRLTKSALSYWVTCHISTEYTSQLGQLQQFISSGTGDWPFLAIETSHIFITPGHRSQEDLIQFFNLRRSAKKTEENLSRAILELSILRYLEIHLLHQCRAIEGFSRLFTELWSFLHEPLNW